MISPAELQHESLKIGAAPIVQHFMERLRLEELFAEAVDSFENRRGRPCSVLPSRSLCLMVANVLLARSPLYGVLEWARSYAPDFLPYAADDIDCINDDRLGRALAKLHASNTPHLLSRIASRAIEEFELDLTQIHNDSTSITFSGLYRNQRPIDLDLPPPRITFGMNKDFRPDLKQLVYALTITADGAVPIHFRVYDGNTSDDRTHLDTWAFVRKLVGSSDFVYIADCKLCSKVNLGMIAQNGGTFITVLPRTWSESKALLHEVATKNLRWVAVRSGDDDPGQAAASVDEPEYMTLVRERKTKSGFRVLGFWSATKAQIDCEAREAKIKNAIDQLSSRERALSHKKDATKRDAEDEIKRILKATGTAKFLNVSLTVEHRTLSTGERRRHFTFDTEEDHAAIRADEKCDGVFPLVTNHPELKPDQVLHLYKMQPFIEKRFEQVKSVLDVPPIFLKRAERVAGLLFVSGVALLVFALIERALRQAMAVAHVKSLPLYHEERLCRAPTTNLIFQAVDDARRHHVRSRDGSINKTFHDPLSPVARDVAKLLGVDLRHYGIEPDAEDAQPPS